VLQDNAPPQVYYLHKPPPLTSTDTTTAVAATTTTAAATTAATAAAAAVSSSRSGRSRRSRYGDAVRGYEEHKGNDNSSSDENDSNSSDVDHSDNDESDTAVNDNNLEDGEIVSTIPSTLPINVLAVLADGTHLLKTPKCGADQFERLRKGPLFLFGIKLAPSERKHGVGFSEMYGALGYLPSENGKETSELLTEWKKESRLMSFFGGRCVYMSANLVYYRCIQCTVV
jgi:hypothetical protein